jgi:hypothetical protein
MFQRLGAEVIIVPVIFGTIAFLAWVIVNGWQRRFQVKLVTDFNSRLLDRIGTLKDFNEFLQTDGGEKLMNSLSVERAFTRPQDRILRAVQLGIVLVMLALGFLGLGWYFAVRYSTSDDFEALTIVGVIALSLGLGFLLSAAASYRLARALGLLDRNGRGQLDAASR